MCCSNPPGEEGDHTLAEGPPVPEEAVHADAYLVRASCVGVTRGTDIRPACWCPDNTSVSHGGRHVLVDLSENLLSFHSKSEFSQTLGLPLLLSPMGKLAAYTQ